MPEVRRYIDPWLDSSGYPHGEKLHLIERFRRSDPGTLRYEVTIEDPEY